MKFKRTSYQFGCLQLKERRDGPDVWVLRYRKPRPDGSTKLASQKIGTTEQYRTASQAWKAAEVFRLSANPDNPAQHGVSWGALIDRYIESELPPRKSTSRFYRQFVRLYVKPKWGSYALTDVKPFAVEEWLKELKHSKTGLPLRSKTKKHIRMLMHILYDCALRWGLVPLGINPFGHRLVPIKDASKGYKRPSMTLDQFHALVRYPLIAEEPFRTMVIGDICTGLRCSELFALKWSDFDWDNLTLYIQRGVVRGTFDRPKTEPSEALLPLAPEVAEVFWNWKQQTPFHQPDDFVFASPFQGGKAPYSPNRVQTRLHEAGLAIGFGDHLGWHTFRHTYRTLLSKARTPVTVQQALMRHADTHQTLKYGEAPTEDQRSASEEVAKLILTRSTQKKRKRNTVNCSPSFPRKVRKPAWIAGKNGRGERI